MSKIVMKCPNDHKPMLDKEKSNENWQVFESPCPECGEKLLVSYE